MERREHPWRDWSCKEKSVLESYARLKEKQPKKLKMKGGMIFVVCWLSAKLVKKNIYFLSF